MPFLPILCLVFVIAKLAGAISWSWWLVFAPVIVPFAIVLFVFAMLGIFYAISN